MTSSASERFNGHVQQASWSTMQLQDRALAEAVRVLNADRKETREMITTLMEGKRKPIVKKRNSYLLDWAVFDMGRLEDIA